MSKAWRDELVRQTGEPERIDSRGTKRPGSDTQGITQNTLGCTTKNNKLPLTSNNNQAMSGWKAKVDLLLS